MSPNFDPIVPGEERAMSLLQMSSMMLSFHKGWDELIEDQPSVSRIFAFVIFPLSLLPPAMIYWAGGHYGDVFVAGVSPQQWHTAAGIFFFAELLTVPLMASLMHYVSRANDVTVEFRECLTLAAVAPIPLWLSSLVLLVPNLVVAVVVGGLALLCSLALTYRGVYALLHMHEDVRALQMATVITGAGLLAWLLLMQIVLIH
jgi:Yip1-like protein